MSKPIRGWPNERTKIQMWIVDDVKPYELNAKIHSEEQVAKIAESIARFGWDQPIVVDKMA